MPPDRGAPAHHEGTMRNRTAAHRHHSTFDVLDHRDAPTTVAVGASLLHFLDSLPARVLVDALTNRPVAEGHRAVVHHNALTGRHHHHGDGSNGAVPAKKKKPPTGIPGPQGPPG